MKKEQNFEELEEHEINILSSVEFGLNEAISDLIHYIRLIETDVENIEKHLKI